MRTDLSCGVGGKHSPRVMGLRRTEHIVSELLGAGTRLSGVTSRDAKDNVDWLQPERTHKSIVGQRCHRR